MPNTINPSFASELEAVAELALDPTQKQALLEIAKTLAVQTPHQAQQDEVRDPGDAIDKGGEAPASPASSASNNSNAHSP
jgi:hypothetical protein